MLFVREINKRYRQEIRNGTKTYTFSPKTYTNMYRDVFEFDEKYQSKKTSKKCCKCKYIGVKRRKEKSIPLM